MNGINPYVLIHSLGTIGNIIQDVSILMGVGLFMASLFRLKRYAEMRTFMSYQLTIWGPLMMMIASILLLCLPIVVRTALLNFWSTNTPLYYHGPLNSYQQLIPPVIVFVRLIGVCSFMRGILLLSRCGSEHSPPGNLSKSMLHMFGGLLCVHILGTVALVKSIFGLVA